MIQGFHASKHREAVMEKYDVIVIGAGPGGYVAAIRCAQLGLKTAVVESWIDEQGQPALGGTCLNVGCIPSKALLDSSHHFHQTRHDLAAHGIDVENVTIDVSRMIARKQDIVKTLTNGIAMLFVKHKITWLKGRARFAADRTVEVIPNHHQGHAASIQADHIIIATGSVPAELPFAAVDQDRIVDSTGALAFSRVPESLVVIGGGVIGLELGSVWSRLGAKVTVLIRGETFLPRVEPSVAQAALRTLTEQGLDIRTRAVPTALKKTARSVTVSCQTPEGQTDIETEKVLVAIGRKPNSQDLNLGSQGVTLDERGFIVVDQHCRTSNPRIFAIGDVVRGPMLAHKASEEGIAVAELIAGHAGHVNYRTIPWVIYTHPEIAWVGQTSTELRQAGIPFKQGTFPFKANGRARSLGCIDDHVTIVSHEQTDEILGVHIIGPCASELIAEAVLAMEYRATAEDLARTVHAHPTLSEALHEAALAVDKRPIHL